MDQNASVALIASIVAVVLGALGLVGGVIGYVQGTAALRRATLIRQRASAAEEAALQARTQAEQSARIAQSVLDRLNALGVRSLGDVADQPTGPLILPARVPPQEPLTPLPTATPSPPAPSPPIPDPPADPPPPADSPAPDPPTPDPPTPDLPPRAVAPSEGGAGSGDSVTKSPDPATPVEAEEEATPGRSATGQVTAGGQESPPMDWAEVLRTGAIPLPARSRGTYSAPAKRSKQAPTGPARFEIRAVGRQRYEAVNTGGTTAEQAAVAGTGEDRHLVSPLETRAKPVPPGAALAFSVLRVEGRNVSVRVSWLAAGTEERVELPLP